MSDLALRWDDAARRFDLVFDGVGGEPGGPILSGDLETEVITRLWSWRRADPADALPDGTAGERHGWWADAYRPDGVDLSGCRWWLLARRVITDAVLAEVRGYIHEALAGLVEDGIASSITVEVARTGTNRVSAAITIHRPGGAAWTRRYDDVWTALGDLP